MFEGFYSCFQRREVTFDVLSVGVEGVLKVVFVGAEFVKSAEHGSGVFCPEYDAVDEVGVQGYSANHFGVEGVGH